jgi:hypothetical protein
MAASTLPQQQAKPIGTISGNQYRVDTFIVDDNVTLHAGDIAISATGETGLLDVAASPVAAAATVVGVCLHGLKSGTGADPAYPGWYLVPEDNSATLQQEDTGGTFGGTFMGIGNLMGSIEGQGMHVAIANRDNIFQLVLTNPIALTYLGKQVGVVQDGTTKVWVIDGASTTAVMQFIGIPNFIGTLYGTVPVNPIPVTGTTGDLYYPVWAQFLDAVSFFGN